MRRRLASLLLALLAGCAHLHGQCTRKEVIVVETTCLNPHDHVDVLHPVLGGGRN